MDVTIDPKDRKRCENCRYFERRGMNGECAFPLPFWMRLASPALESDDGQDCPSFTDNGQPSSADLDRHYSSHRRY